MKPLNPRFILTTLHLYCLFMLSGCEFTHEQEAAQRNTQVVIAESAGSTEPGSVSTMNAPLSPQLNSVLTVHSICEQNYGNHYTVDDVRIWEGTKAQLAQQLDSLVVGKDFSADFKLAQNFSSQAPSFKVWMAVNNVIVWPNDIVVTQDPLKIYGASAPWLKFLPQLEVIGFSANQTQIENKARKTQTDAAEFLDKCQFYQLATDPKSGQQKIIPLWAVAYKENLVTKTVWIDDRDLTIIKIESSQRSQNPTGINPVEIKPVELNKVTTPSGGLY